MTNPFAAEWVSARKWNSKTENIYMVEDTKFNEALWFNNTNELQQGKNRSPPENNIMAWN
jgi:hypothetical protein